MLELALSRVVSLPRGFETPRGSLQATAEAQHAVSSFATSVLIAVPSDSTTQTVYDVD